MGSIESANEEQPIKPKKESAADQLKRIEEKITAVEKRLSDKWILPVSLAVLSAILTLGNYFVQRLFINSDVFKNQINKSNAEFKAKTTSEFYQTCFLRLDTINKNFESFCKISPSNQEDSVITVALIRLTSQIDHQFPIDPLVKQRLQDYASYISNKLVDFQSAHLNSLELIKTYEESKKLYDQAVTEINAAFLDPSR